MSIPSWARVGAKVVCVSKAQNLRPGERQLVVGEIYTIRSIENDSDGVGFTLSEIVNPTRYYDGGECFYLLSRFRPLITLEDDLEAHFTNLLRQPVSSKEPA